jgi:hypothetical protein
MWCSRARVSTCPRSEPSHNAYLWTRTHQLQALSLRAALRHHAVAQQVPFRITHVDLDDLPIGSCAPPSAGAVLR